MADFWPNSGFQQRHRQAGGLLAVSDDYLRALYRRPEVEPVPDSCAAERELHASLLREPRRAVGDGDLAALADPDARDNYAVILRLRERLLAADSIEACYIDLFRGAASVDLPAVLIDRLAEAVAHNVLAGTDDALRVRAGEMLFREQAIERTETGALAHDAETYRPAPRAPATGGGAINLLALARDAEVLSAANANGYWAASDRFQFALDLSFGAAGLPALAAVFEAWIAHFLGVAVSIEPLERIDDEHWRWHLGLDAESSALLNDLYAGATIEDERLGRLISLFRLSFQDPNAMRSDIAGHPVYLGMAMTASGRLRLKPQNLLVNLPVARPA